MLSRRLSPNLECNSRCNVFMFRCVSLYIEMIRVTDVGQTPLFAAHSLPFDAHLPFPDRFLS
ncbi:hypothetical protein BD310DRAFT_684247 [Dichomitus squalens]|uniref:Uncharacterized protein n=1 Tax=Dichomitus squalens TaxID=114155 RepID=A0A4Q9PMG6_9APHY|nr:hypothetical protein BD310DRAFT_684247 [Dichomitus squalens]